MKHLVRYSILAVILFASSYAASAIVHGRINQAVTVPIPTAEDCLKPYRLICHQFGEDARQTIYGPWSERAASFPGGGWSYNVSDGKVNFELVEGFSCQVVRSKKSKSCILPE